MKLSVPLILKDNQEDHTIFHFRTIQMFSGGNDVNPKYAENLLGRWYYIIPTINLKEDLIEEYNKANPHDQIQQD